MKKLIVLLVCAVSISYFYGCGQQKDPNKYVLNDSLAQALTEEIEQLYMLARQRDAKQTPLFAIFSDPFIQYASLPKGGSVPINGRTYSLEICRYDDYIAEGRYSYFSYVSDNETIASEPEVIPSYREIIKYVHDNREDTDWIESYRLQTDSSGMRLAVLIYDDAETAFKKFQELHSQQQYIVNYQPAKTALICQPIKMHRRRLK